MPDRSLTFLGRRPVSLPPSAAKVATTSDFVEAGANPSAADAHLNPRSPVRHVRGRTRRPRSEGSAAMLEAHRRRTVLGPCPEVGRSTPTHALMNARELSRFEGELVYWCAHCRAAHRASWPQLQLSCAEATVAAAHENAQIDASPA